MLKQNNKKIKKNREDYLGVWKTIWRNGRLPGGMEDYLGVWKTTWGYGRLPGGMEREEHDDCGDEDNCHAEILLLLVHSLLPLVDGLYLVFSS